MHCGDGELTHIGDGVCHDASEFGACSWVRSAVDVGEVIEIETCSEGATLAAHDDDLYLMLMRNPRTKFNDFCHERYRQCVKALWPVEDDGADGVTFGVFPPKVLQCRDVLRSH